ncbi:helix-turn-helix domain-containing protein [Paenibacillus terrigena]|uniref:helix-turn-helix domain-containing protein n=1 Tax=Paenibacillus terrigena TaxID=369333 RepID=UPI000369A014|nr:helix-turn-helix domain-containing protein [Paenibacillus terrigena]
MYKVVIVDDEPKIRRRLVHALDWTAMDMEVVGEAEDGEMALDIATRMLPDLMLVDICIPFLSGLDLIHALREKIPDCLFIVITGFDDFTYAQQALRLAVFDYLLKPVRKEHLYEVVQKAQEKMTRRKQIHQYHSWTEQQLKKSDSALKERFWHAWMSGLLEGTEVRDQLAYLDVQLPEHFGMMLVRVGEKGSYKQGAKEWDHNLLMFAIQNVTEEFVRACAHCTVFRDGKSHLVVLVSLSGQELSWTTLGDQLTAFVEQLSSRSIVIQQGISDRGVASIPGIYVQLHQALDKEDHRSPVVMNAKKFIDANYHQDHISLQDVAERFQISPAYLSRLLRQELGMSFIDYVTEVRIQHALRLMQDPQVKIYEISERIGYASQHYFSVAFKKVLGVSPTEYRKGVVK